MRSPGHLFIIRGDLTRLACDAWLLPTDEHLSIPSDGWFTPESGLARKPDRTLAATPPPAWGTEIRTFRLGGDTVAGRPDPWPTITGADDRDATWYADGAEAFVRSAAAALRDRTPHFGRARHLLGVPFVGRGDGGGAEFAGEVAAVLITRLDALVNELDVDVVFVASNERDFASAQNARRNVAGADLRSAWRRHLDDQTLAVATDLAARARRGDLVVFAGAGLSRAAGLPDWRGLLEDLAAGHRDLDHTARQELAAMDPTDQAQVLQTLGDQGTLREAIVERFSAAGRPSIGQFLVASIPADALATTNYDNLLEDACRYADRPVRSFHGSRDPSPVPETDRWLFKIHGCVSDPDSIVLSRQDYLAYERSRGALSGIVQALLVTKHMLFLGFSLEDPNFHQIVDEVRQILPDPSSTPDDRQGTVVFLDRMPLRAKLWKQDFRIVELSTEASGSTGPGVAEAARRAEIFLDLILAESADRYAHLLDPVYVGQLDEDEQILRDALEDLRRRIRPVRGTEAARPVVELLERFGDPTRPGPTSTPDATTASG